MSTEKRKNVYIGHRYVPKIMGEWDKTESYEGLSIVTNKGTSYTSKKRVPKGIDILNEEYWVVTGNYNAQIEEYRKDIREVEKEVNKKADKTSLNEFKTNIDNQISSFKNEINGDFTNFSNGINQKIEEFEETNNTNLTEFKENINNDLLAINTNISNLEESKKQKEKSNIYASDYSKLAQETDDEFINRLLGYLPDYQGTVYLDGGEYILQDSIKLYKYQTIKGVGQSTVLKSDVNKPIITVATREMAEYVYGISIKNLSLQGNGNNIGIDLAKSTHVLIEDVYIYDTDKGITGTNVWLATYNRVTIRNYIKMGTIGFDIQGGTSNVLTNVWVKNFSQGYLLYSLYSTLNSCACDTFVEYAYYIGQATTLNSCGAEDGQMVNGSYVFGAAARSVVFNACETMKITYSGDKDKGSVFYLNGTTATINNYSHSGTVELSENLSFVILRGGAYLNINTSHISAGLNGTKFNFEKYNSRSAVVYEQYRDKLSFHRWNGENILYPTE